MELKTAQELRAIAAVAGGVILKQMNYECGNAAKGGLSRHEFLQDKQVSTDAVDFAISAMVAIGFSIDPMEHDSIIHDKYLITW